MLTLRQAVEDFRRTGIQKGDTVMVHSSFRSLGPVEGGADTIIDALMEAVGSEGTVLFPTFNFHAWTEEHYWDINETPSEMGALTEVARKRPRAVRTPHPIYSFAALGARAEEFASCDDPEALGDGSVFGLFHRLDGLIVSIGLDYNSSFTMVHYVERANGAPYRRTKRFGGIYVGRDGEPRLRSFTMFVRREETRTMINPAMVDLVAREVVGQTHLGEATVAFCRAGTYFSEITRVVRERPNQLHEAVRQRS